MRPSGRKISEMRKVSIETNVNKHAEGSCIISFGDTKVLCTASVENRIPPFLRGTGKGWVTAEYGMLPRSTGSRIDREAKRGQKGRTQEIQRLIGRSLRSVVDLEKIREKIIIVDCDVLQADGGTRTASITGGFVAMYLAFQNLVMKGQLATIPIKEYVAAVSCGLYKGTAVLDLDFAEDSNAEADCNFVMTSKGRIVEIQGTAEDEPFTEEQFAELMSLAKKGIADLVEIQKETLRLKI